MCALSAIMIYMCAHYTVRVDMCAHSQVCVNIFALSAVTIDMCAHSEITAHMCALHILHLVNTFVHSLRQVLFSFQCAMCTPGIILPQWHVHCQGCILQNVLHTTHYKMHSTLHTTNYTAHTAHSRYSTAPLPLTMRCTTQWNSCLGGARSFGLPGCQELLWLSTICHPLQLQP